MEPAKEKPKASLLGCVLALILSGLILYGSIAGLGLFIWGNGLRGAMSVHRNPSIVQSFHSITIYSNTITATPEQLVISRAWWASARNSLLVALAVVIAAAIASRPMRRRRPLALLFIASALLLFLVLYFFTPRTTFNLNERTVEVRSFVSTKTSAFADVVLATGSGDVGGGRSGTRNTTAMWKSEDVILLDRDGLIMARLMALPFETKEFAYQWRDEIARRTSVRVQR